MPSNIIKVNNGGKGFEWNVPDSKMDELLKYMNDKGDPFVEPPCKHEHAIKAISIPITDNGRGELDYEELLNIAQKIVSKDTDSGFTWFEVLVCLDCGQLLEHNDVFIPDPEHTHEIEHGEFECGQCKLDVRNSDTYTRIRVDGKYDFFFNRDGSFDGIGIDMPDAAEQEEFRKRMVEDESPVECITKGPGDYVRTHQ